MFGMGWFEILVILVLALVVLGPEKLPGIARTAGKAMRQLRRATSDLRQAIDLDGMREDLSLNKTRTRDPYAGLAEEESSWGARSRDEDLKASMGGHDPDEDSFEDNFPAHRHHGDLYAPPAALEAARRSPQAAGYGAPAARRVIIGGVEAVAIKALALDPHAVHVAAVQAPALHLLGGVLKAPVRGGIAQRLAEMEAEARRAATPKIKAVSIASSAASPVEGAQLRRAAIVAPPLELLGGVKAVALKGFEAASAPDASDLIEAEAAPAEGSDDDAGADDDAAAEAAQGQGAQVERARADEAQPEVLEVEAEVVEAEVAEAEVAEAVVEERVR